MKKMKKIKDIISKPSEALQAMVDGLKKQSKRKDFEVNMGTFGMSTGKMCYGCAATCTLQQLTGVNLTGIFSNELDVRANKLQPLATLHPTPTGQD